MIKLISKFYLKDVEQDLYILSQLYPLSEIFLVIFSILYGIVLNACVGLTLFPFGRLFKNGKVYKKVWLRLGFSLVVINLLPFLVFYGVLDNLQEHQIVTMNFWNILGIVFLSMIVFGFYRISHVLISVKKQWLYDLDKNWEKKWFNEKRNQCAMYEDWLKNHKKWNREELSESTLARIQNISNSSWKGQLLGVLFYFCLFLVGLGLVFL